MKRRKAVAVGYQPGDAAPKVLARGMNHLADTLKRLAAENGVPVVVSAHLADSLSSLNPLDDIPEDYWSVVAEILKFVYETRDNDEWH